ncbi:MAG: PAS domain S-box protein [bacterium]
MNQPAVRRALRRALPLLACGIAVVAGATLRVRYLRHEMMTRWRGALEGGALTTLSTVDDWYTDRAEDARALAATVAVSRHLPSRSARERALRDVLTPIIRRGKFVGAYIVDSAGQVLTHSPGDSLREPERRAIRAAIASGSLAHSDIMPLGPHAAWFSLAAPVRIDSGVRAAGNAPAAILLRTDVARAFAPWAAGRPNAAMSLLATRVATGGIVLISACPEQAAPVCIVARPSHDSGSPSALALAHTDSFGLFRSYDGQRVLAVTRYDPLLGWGVSRRIAYVDAVVPLNTELAIEGAFLAVLLALAGLGAFAVNRTVRLRRLSAQRVATGRLATVVDASTDGLVSFDSAFAITMVNAAVHRMLGYSGGELVGQPIFSLFGDEWRAPLAETLRQLAESDVPHAPVAQTERFIARRADGQGMPVDARVGRAVVGGQPLFVMGLRDVTDRARSERFLHEQRRILELIATGAPIEATLTSLLAAVHEEAPSLRCAVYEIDDERQEIRTLCAPRLPTDVIAAMEFVGLGSRSAVGEAIRRGDLVVSADISSDPRWQGTGALLASHGIRSARVRGLHAADGRLIGAIAAFNDATDESSERGDELARAAVHLASIALSSAGDAAALRASEASFRSFVENAPTAIFRETRAGALVSSNRAMIELLGFPDATALAHAADQDHIYHDPAARTRLIAALERDGVANGMEMEWRRADDTLVIVRVSARAYRDERDRVWLWEAYAENVTSLRAAEVALHRSGRLAAVGQLISGVAHELNNPLSSILHFTEDLLADQRSGPDTEALGIIRDQAQRSRAIVRDLLSFVQRRETSAESISLAERLAATTVAMRPGLAEGGVRLHVAAQAAACMVWADRAGLEQIITNLVSNAAHAAGRGGDVWVSTQWGEDECSFVVEDSGPGIPDEVLARIFDPFFTTKRTGEGTGLGLSVTLGIVEQLGGRIATSARGLERGARFTVFLPCATPALPDGIALATPLAAEAASVEGGRSPSMTGAPESGSSRATAHGIGPAVAPQRVALIIDDEQTIRTALRRYFVRRGWRVEEATDGEAALTLLADDSARFDIIVSDLRMPGVSGVELHDRLVAQPALLRRFVFSTGDVASDEAAAFVRRTHCQVLQKPFELRMLDAAIVAVDTGVDAQRVIT